jgi:hypothetical protein
VAGSAAAAVLPVTAGPASASVTLSGQTIGRVGAWVRRMKAVVSRDDDRAGCSVVMLARAQDLPGTFSLVFAVVYPGAVAVIRTLMTLPSTPTSHW